MYNSDTEILFPPRVIPTLRNLRGETWMELVDEVSQLPPASLDRQAFVLLMVRLGNCSTCHADSFRALNGCTQCASQTVRRFKGSDQELVSRFSEARKQIEHYLGN